MSLAPRSWWLPYGSLEYLGGLGRRLLGCPGPSFGLSSPVCFLASSFCCAASSSQLLSRLCAGPCSYCCGVRPTRKRRHRTCVSGSGVLQPAFVIPKVTGGWRPVIDLSRLNRFVRLSRFRMETSASVLQSLRPGDWMVSLDLQDAYLQVPVHPDSQRFLRFCVGAEVFQFKALCFGLSSAPQVFTRVMAPVSSIMHRYGFRILRYLDDWLVLGSSFQEITRARDFLLWLCDRLGTLLPSQRLDYQGMTLQSTPLRAFPTQLECTRRYLSSPNSSPPGCSRALSGSLFWESCRLSRRWFWAPGSECRHSNTTCWWRVPISGTTSWFPGTIPASRIFGGGPSLPTSRSGFLWTFPIRISSCTPTPRTRVGVRL